MKAPYPHVGYPQDLAAANISGRVQRRNIRINGRRTTVKLEAEMWDALDEICQLTQRKINLVCTEVARSEYARTNFTSVLRLFILDFYRSRADLTVERDRLRRRANRFAAGA